MTTGATSARCLFKSICHCDELLVECPAKGGMYRDQGDEAITDTVWEIASSR